MLPCSVTTVTSLFASWLSVAVYVIDPPSSLVEPSVKLVELVNFTVSVSSSSVILFVTGVASNPNFSKLPTALGFSCDTDVILLEIESSSLYTSSLFTLIVNVPVLPSAITPFPKSLPFLWIVMLPCSVTTVTSLFASWLSVAVYVIDPPSSLVEPSVKLVELVNVTVAASIVSSIVTTELSLVSKLT